MAKNKRNYASHGLKPVNNSQIVIIGVLTTRYAKDDFGYCSRCSDKSSLRKMQDEIK